MRSNCVNLNGCAGRAYWVFAGWDGEFGTADDVVVPGGDFDGYALWYMLGPGYHSTYLTADSWYVPERSVLWKTYLTGDDGAETEVWRSGEDRGDRSVWTARSDAEGNHMPFRHSDIFIGQWYDVYLGGFYCGEEDDPDRWEFLFPSDGFLCETFEEAKTHAADILEASVMASGHPWSGGAESWHGISGEELDGVFERALPGVRAGHGAQGVGRPGFPTPGSGLTTL